MQDTINSNTEKNIDQKTDREFHPLVDCHVHCIPGVDDGSVNLDMSLEMLRMAYAQGERAIICTSHDLAYQPECEQETCAAFETLKAAAFEQLPGLKLYKGCEIYCRPEKMDYILEDLEKGIIPSYNNTKYVLAEFYDPDAFSFEEVSFCLEKLAAAGWTPIIAHMERYPSMVSTLEQVRTLKEMGCLVQINVYSIEEESKDTTREWANELLAAGLVDFLGSDAHRTTHRPPSVAIGLKSLYARYPREYADAISFGNAVKYLGAEMTECKQAQ